MVTSKPNSQWFPKNHWTCQWSSQINIILKVWNYPVVTISILIWLVCSKVWISCLDIYCRALQLQTKFTSCQLSFCMLYTVTSSPPWIIHSNRSSVHDITFYMVFMTFWDILLCIVWISHCEMMSGLVVTRYGHIIRVLLKVCVFLEIGEEFSELQQKK